MLFFVSTSPRTFYAGVGVHHCSSGPDSHFMITHLETFVLYDLCLQWTEEGDAFIIGSDIKRLESETLPKFFRHNRFQSLVRQLNFYSFRKINRERNVWIYKHELFHRDHPENLFMVRRRTCPGLDGRKQRFSKFKVRRANEQDPEVEDDEEVDDSSSIESSASPAESSAQLIAMRHKRVADETDFPPSSVPTKRVSTGSVSSSIAAIVDTSMVQPSNEISETEDTDDHTSTSKAERVSFAEQSMIVSEVAMKLDEYARKALKSRPGGKSRRSGVVTPPTVSASSLFTYDDEFDPQCHEDRLIGTLSASPMAMGDKPVPSFAVPSRHASARANAFKKDQHLVAPVMDSQTALAITNDMVLNSPEDLRSSLIAPTAVACFCMSTCPFADKHLCTKILHLVASCDKLSEDFQLYLSALHPVVHREESPAARGPLAELQRTWGREASREDAVREFKTFAVNCLHKLLALESYGSSNLAMLERTASAWRESIGFE
jgi:HSF-type DNA-binding